MYASDPGYERMNDLVTQHAFLSNPAMIPGYAKFGLESEENKRLLDDELKQAKRSILAEIAGILIFGRQL